MDFWVFTSKIRYTFGGSGVTGDDDDFGTPVFEGFCVSSDDFLEFLVGFFAIRTIFGVGNVFVFFIWKNSLDGAQDSSATDAGIK